MHSSHKRLNVVTSGQSLFQSSNASKSYYVVCIAIESMGESNKLPRPAHQMMTQQQQHTHSDFTFARKYYSVIHIVAACLTPGHD
jgi:hypothetical protein